MRRAVRATEQDCTLLATSVSTAWEVTASWGNALKEFFPLYAQREIVQSLVSVNVPFNIPVLEFGKDLFKLVSGE